MANQSTSRVDTPGKHLRRMRLALGYSWAGLRAAYREEAAIRLEAWAVALLLPVALCAPVGPASKGVMVLALFMVPMAELVNSAIEAAVDRIGAERHELSGRAKDMGSAAVLLAVAGATVAWGACLWPWLAALAR